MYKAEETEYDGDRPVSVALIIFDFFVRVDFLNFPTGSTRVRDESRVEIRYRYARSSLKRGNVMVLNIFFVFIRYSIS